MRAKVFQLEPVKKDEYKDSGYRLLNSFSFNDRLVFPDPTMIDWWSDAEDIKGSFSKLVSDLPNGMFVVNEDEMPLTKKFTRKPTNFSRWMNCDKNNSMKILIFTETLIYCI